MITLFVHGDSSEANGGVWWSAVEAHSHKVLPPLYAAVEAGAPLLLLPAARHQSDM